MASILAGLRGGLLRDLGRSTALDGGFKKYLGQANIVPQEIDGSQLHKFSVQDSDLSMRYLAGDFGRFAISSFESFYRALEPGTGNLSFEAWRLLELYYAGYFAAHSIMRSQGAGVSFVSQSEAKRVNELAQIYEISTTTVDPGTWAFSFSVDGANTNLSLFTTVNGSGAHDTFWRQFCQFLKDRASLAVREGMPDSDQFSVAAVELIDSILTNGIGSASWLAARRNAINYRHELGVWFPKGKGILVDFSDRTSSTDAASTFRLDLSKSKEGLQLFQNVNLYLVHTAFEISKFYQAQSRQSGRFGAKFSRFLAVRGN